MAERQRTGEQQGKEIRKHRAGHAANLVQRLAEACRIVQFPMLPGMALTMRGTQHKAPGACSIQLPL